MADPTVEYFAGPARQRADLLPSGFSATVRLDLRRAGRTDHWYLVLDERDVTISEEGERAADCVISADGEVFDRIVAGADATAATLRNELTYRGAPVVLIYFQRLLPGPPGSHGPDRVDRGDGGDRGR
ncbi:SCP2 sterol-binding domain-containing protein [Plantactinospora sp. CA-294935]|jgi:putative sterol carrier protein|uniref:SCP2 sterol-binding domain-containing protein n=1 Tax=Plantactinospora sp. CA-294935 TaxID=3240012 RepID=UPI003D8B4245